MNSVHCPKCMIAFETSDMLEKHIDDKHPGFATMAFAVLLFRLCDDLNRYEKATTYGDSAIAISTYLRDLISKL